MMGSASVEGNGTGGTEAKPTVSKLFRLVSPPMFPADHDTIESVAWISQGRNTTAQMLRTLCGHLSTISMNLPD